MRRILYAALSTLSALVLLFSYRTSTEAVTPVAEVATTDASNEVTTAPDSATSPQAESTPEVTQTEQPEPTRPESDQSESDQSESTGVQTFTGTAAGTRYGDVQVQITVENGVITDATAIEYPDRDPHDARINAKAVPILESETLSAQSADIDMVSGATYTSQGYVASLQSALDQAGL